MATLEELFPINLAERPVRFDSADISPVSLLRNELGRSAAAQRNRLDQLLATMATTWFQLTHLTGEISRTTTDGASWCDGLEIIRANLLDEIRKYGVEVRDLTGQPFVAEQQDLVDVRGHRANPDLAGPRVWHMEQPIVIREGRCLVRGVVILESPPRAT